jgi:hypothetical protein
MTATQLGFEEDHVTFGRLQPIGLFELSRKKTGSGIVSSRKAPEAPDPHNKPVAAGEVGGDGGSGGGGAGGLVSDLLGPASLQANNGKTTKRTPTSTRNLLQVVIIPLQSTPLPLRQLVLRLYKTPDAMVVE